MRSIKHFYWPREDGLYFASENQLYDTVFCSNKSYKEYKSDEVVDDTRKCTCLDCVVSLLSYYNNNKKHPDYDWFFRKIQELEFDRDLDEALK